MFVLSFSFRVGIQPSPEGSWQENTQLKELCNQLNFFFISPELPGCLRSQCSNLVPSGHRLLTAALSLWILSTRSCSAASFLCWEGLTRHVATQLVVVTLETHCWGLLGRQAADKPCKTSRVKNRLLFETENFLMPFRSSPYLGLSLHA